MSLVSLQINETWRDYDAHWNTAMLPWITKLEESKCLAPRWVVLPPLEQGVIPSSGKLLYNFHLVPGSLIWGIGGGAGESFQLTDVGVGHQLFQEPLEPIVVQSPFNVVGVNEDFMILPCPWPITGDGLFTLEIWGTAGDFVNFLLFVAEVTDCPVR